MPSIVLHVHESLRMAGKRPKNVLSIRMDEARLRRITGMGAREFEKAVRMLDHELDAYLRKRGR